MIDELIVSNLGLIDEARLEPGPGLTVITGETGAGKTLLLGALRLLLGESTKPDLVGPFAEEARVDGRWVSRDGTEVAATRRMPRGGRSRAYLDGSVASAAALDAATAGLVEIIGQHDQISLTRPAEARLLVDAGLDESGAATRARYASAWSDVQDLESRQARIGGDRRALERERDLARHQAEEIAGAGFVSGDDTELEIELGRLRHAAEIAEFLEETADALGRARDSMGDAVAAARRASRLDPTLEDVDRALTEVEQRLGESAIDVAGRGDDLDTDPASLARAEERFGVLADLKRKYGSTLEDVLTFEKEMAGRSAELAGLLESADRIEADLATATDELVAAGEALSIARLEAGRLLTERAVAHLEDLGFSDPFLEVSLESVEPSANGADRIRFAFASDRRLAPGDLASVASGGELSRLVLSLRLAGGVGDSETLVFDEIDAGVGGVTAVQMGAKLAHLARSRQVLCVTHLPQVAAFATRHYRIERTDGRAVVIEVTGDERVEEIARMLSGTPDATKTREAAAELLSAATTS